MKGIVNVSFRIYSQKPLNVYVNLFSSNLVDGLRHEQDQSTNVMLGSGISGVAQHNLNKTMKSLVRHLFSNAVFW